MEGEEKRFARPVSNCFLCPCTCCYQTSNHTFIFFYVLIILGQSIVVLLCIAAVSTAKMCWIVTGILFYQPPRDAQLGLLSRKSAPSDVHMNLGFSVPFYCCRCHVMYNTSE